MESRFRFTGGLNEPCSLSYKNCSCWRSRGDREDVDGWGCRSLDEDGGMPVIEEVVVSSE